MHVRNFGDVGAITGFGCFDLWTCAQSSYGSKVNVGEGYDGPCIVIDNITCAFVDFVSVDDARV